MSIGKPLHLRLFLEGQEVPVISAQVDVTMNAPAAAALQVVPLDEVMNLKPRTMVHLFFLEESTLSDQRGNTTDSKSLVGANIDTAYKLLFSGEVVGFSFMKQPMARAVVLQCLDFSSYWDTAQAASMEYGNGSFISNKGYMFGADTSLFDDIVSHHAEQLSRWIRQTPETHGLKGVNGLAGGIIKLMEQMGGVKDSHKKGVNDFFTIAELRCRLLAQVAAEEGDDTASKLLSTQVFWQWLTNGLQSLGQQVSLRDMIKLLCQFIYYDFVPNPAAKFDQAEKGTQKTVESARLKTQIFRPDCFMVAPPRCNVFFPEQYTSVTYDRTFINEVTRMLVLVYCKLWGTEGEPVSDLLSNKIFAPILTEEAKKLAKETNTNQYRLLMPHELHTGIIPRVEWLPDSMAVDKKLHGDEAVKLQGEQISWGKKTAMHHFFKYRIGPRQAQVTGRFNPYMVCGFPGLVITRPFFLDKSSIDSSTQSVLDYVHDSKKMADLGMPHQLLGLVGAMTHIVNQDGGQTNFVMTHVRSHLGIDDEFVGTVLASLRSSNTKKRVRYTLDLDEILSSGQADQEKTLQHLISLTPQDALPPIESQMPTGYAPEFDVSPMSDSLNVKPTEAIYQKVEWNPVTGRRQAAASSSTVSTSAVVQSSSPAPKYVAVGTITGVDGKVKIPKPPGRKTVGSHGLFGKIAGVQVIEPYEPRRIAERTEIAYSRVIVYEDIDLKVSADVPVEEVVRPGWMSTLYDNENVGPKVYQPFFGCDSVVDGLEVSGPNGKVTTATVNPRQPECEDVSAFDSTELLKKHLREQEEARQLLSVERAVNSLSYLYGLVRSEHADVDEFVTTYTWRPIASKLDVLGSQDLKIKIQGKKAVVEAGKVGFHSMAVNPVTALASNLIGLLEDPDEKFTRLEVAKQSSTLPPQYDVRKEKLERVLDYRRALESGERGFLG